MSDFNKKLIFFEKQVKEKAPEIFKKIPTKNVVISEDEKITYLQRAFKRIIVTLSLMPSKTKAKVLDLGVSPYFLALLIKEIFKYDVTGIQSPNVRWPGEEIKITKGEKINGIPEYYCNVEKDKLPFKDKTFDIVICTEIIEHLLQDPLFMLKEIRRVLKKDGTVILSTPNAINLYSRMRLLFGRNIYAGYSPYGPYGRHNREFTVDELRTLFKKAKLEIHQVILLNKSSAGMRREYEKSLVINFIYSLLTKLIPVFRENIFIVAHVKQCLK